MSLFQLFVTFHSTFVIVWETVVPASIFSYVLIIFRFTYLLLYLFIYYTSAVYVFIHMPQYLLICCNRSCRYIRHHQYPPQLFIICVYIYLSAAYTIIPTLQYLFICCYLVLYIYSSFSLTVHHLSLYHLPQCTTIALFIQYLSLFLQSVFSAVIPFTVLSQSYTTFTL